MSKSDDFIVLCGCPRSGSYLLTSQLAKLGVTIPLETHYITAFRRFLFLWGDLNKASNQRHLLSSINGFVRALFFGMQMDESEERDAASILRVIDEVELDGVHDFQGLNRAIFSTYMTELGGRYFGDKATFYKPADLDGYKAAVGPIKVIHIVRDGRDVALSWRKTWFGPRSIQEAALLWQSHVRSYSAWGATHPEHYCEVRYEDLLSDTDGVLDLLSKFLGAEGGEKISAEQLDALQNAMKSQSEHKNVAKNVDSSNTQKWRAEMPDSDIRLFESLAGDSLTAFGYDVVNEGQNSGQASQWHILYSKFLSVLSPNFFKRLVKSVTPLLMWLYTFTVRYKN